MLTTLRRVVRQGRKTELGWRYFYNLAPTMLYQAHRRSVLGEAARVVDALNRDGVAITTAGALFQDLSLLDALQSEVEELERRFADEINAGDAGGRREKSFIIPLLGELPKLDPQAVFTRFALQSTVLDIANSYLGMYSRLRYFNVWHTLASPGEPGQSQLWHRDREDRYILKMFVYLSDVDEGAGPFTYARGSHIKGRVRINPPYFLESGVPRSTDQQMETAVPADSWIKCTGTRGTIIFADTHGYHKGGLARTHDRLMYTCMFTSPASESREFLRRPDGLLENRKPELAFALAARRAGPWLRLRQ